MRNISKLLLSLTVLVTTGSAFAASPEELCETIPANSKQIHVTATTTDEPNAVNVGTTSSFLNGHDKRFMVNQHNGQPVIITKSCDGKMIVDSGPKVKGLLITTPEFYHEKMHDQFHSEGMFIKNLPVLTDDPDVKDHIYKYKDKPVNNQLLNEVIRDIVVLMRDKNQPVVDVYFPEQDVTDGFIVALVSRATVNKIIVNGNKYYSDQDILRFVSAKPGEYIWSDELSKDLRWINSYPYRQVDVIFKPGDKPKTTDLVYETKDQYPFRLFGGMDNYGSPTTSQNEYYAGFSYGNLFGLDHELIYTFGAGFDYDKFSSHTLQYNIPIADWRHRLSFTGNVSESQADIGPISQDGTNYTVNVNYEMPLNDYGFRGFIQSLNVGADWKRLENDIEFGGTNVFNSTPEIAQLYVTYQGSKTSANTLDTYILTAVASPGGVTGNNTSEDFDIARTGADSQYTYYKGFYQTTYTEPTTTLSFSGIFRGQYAPQEVLSSEQIAISGPGAVRGFAANSVRRDSGYVGTLEIASPYVPVLDTILQSSIRDRVQGFVFYDHGHGVDNNSSTDGITLDSAGVGTRFGISNNLNGTVEYGRELHDEQNNGIDNEIHFRLNAAY